MQSWNVPPVPPMYEYSQLPQHPFAGHHPFYKGEAPFQVNPPAATPFEQFAKPPFPSGWSSPSYQGKMPVNFSWNQSQSPKGFLQYFQDKNGELDIDKMLGTVGQVAHTYHQIAPIFKGVGGLLKGINK